MPANFAQDQLLLVKMLLLGWARRAGDGHLPCLSITDLFILEYTVRAIGGLTERLDTCSVKRTRTFIGTVERVNVFLEYLDLETEISLFTEVDIQSTFETHGVLQERDCAQCTAYSVARPQGMTSVLVIRLRAKAAVFKYSQGWH